jgi:hypothetical protein
MGGLAHRGRASEFRGAFFRRKGVVVADYCGVRVANLMVLLYGRVADRRR